MPPRLKRTAASFAVVLLAFCSYRLLVAPWIDPSFALEGPTANAGDGTAPRVVEPTDYRQLFPEGSWERNDPIVLENEGVKLLMEDYQNLDGGRIGLDKCTMLFFPDGDYQPEADHQRIVVLSAPGGAVLQFDSELNLKRGKVGKLIGGQLKGTVKIRGTPSRPGADDDLFITTSDVRLDQRTAFTDSPVEFRYGPHHGHGRQLRINLIASPSGANRGPNFTGIQQLELLREVEMHLEPGAGLLPGDGDRKPSAVVPLPNPVTGRPEYQEPPISIRCRGPFRFDFVVRMASFEDQVDVHRPMPQGPADQMKCDLLKIYFATKAKQPESQNATTQATPADNQSQFGMTLVRMEATGGPVRLDAPSNGVVVRTNRIDYERKENRLTVQSVRGNPDSVVVWGRNEYRGRDLTVAQPERGRLATASAKESGWLRAVPPDRPDQTLEARWTREMSMCPENNGQHRISLRGSAETKFTEFGELAAEQIDVWLLESPRPASSADPVARESIPATPVRLLAKHNVGFRSAQLNGTTGQLNVVFASDVESNEVGSGAQLNSQSPQTSNQPEPAPRAAIRAARPVVPVLPPPAGAAKPRGLLGHAGAKSRFELQGRTIDVQLVSLGQRSSTAAEQYVLDGATVDGAVRMVEVPTASTNPLGKPVAAPLVMSGERLEIRNGRVQSKAQLAITGKPAQVSARGMELVGERVQLNRGENRLWIDGAGRCVLPARSIASDRQLPPTTQAPSGRSAGELSGAPVTIDFHDGMVFDGKTARFRRDVVASSVVQRVIAGQTQPRTESRKLNTQEIVATFRRAVDFSSEQLDQQAEVERIACLGGVNMESRTSDHRGLVSIETLHTRDLDMLQATGDLRALGPGRLESTRLSAASPLSARLPATSVRQPQKPNQLNYTRVDFTREVTGNLNAGQIILHEDIQGIYGPVQRWGDQIPLESFDELPEGCVTFSSDQLIANNVSATSAGGGNLELQAIGNAEFQGQLFLAQGDRVTYVASKEQLSLEGDGRTPARIFYRQHKGGPQTEATAGKITYWLNENRADVNNASRINLGQ
jgi:hypothetical protein